MKNQHNRTHTNPRFMMPSTVPGHIGQKEGRGRKLFPPGSFGFPSPGVLASKTSHKAVLLQLRCLGKDLGLKFEIEAMSRCLGHQYININEYKKIYQIHILICIYHYIYISVWDGFEANNCLVIPSVQVTGSIFSLQRDVKGVADAQARLVRVIEDVSQDTKRVFRLPFFFGCSIQSCIVIYYI